MSEFSNNPSSSTNITNNNDFARSTTILTEHLGYAPIALIDDVINAVNEILYKCTSAMEAFLRQRHSAQYAARANGGEDEIDDVAAAELEEIELGTAKLETFMESVVDKSFDRFELYVLRNILVVPPELVAGGWIRLAHQRGIDFTPSSSNNRVGNGSDISIQANDSSRSYQGLSNDTIVDLYTELSVQKRANTILRAHKQRMDRLVASLERFSTSFILPPAQGGTGGMPDDMRARFRAISPIAESLNFLATQVRATSEKVQQLEQDMQQFSQPSHGGDSGGSNVGGSSAQAERDMFVDALTQRAVNMTGLGSYPFADEANAPNQGVADDEIRLVPDEQIKEAQELVDLITQ